MSAGLAKACVPSENWFCSRQIEFPNNYSSLHRCTGAQHFNLYEKRRPSENCEVLRVRKHVQKCVLKILLWPHASTGQSLWCHFQCERSSNIKPKPVVLYNQSAIERLHQQFQLLGRRYLKTNQLICLTKGIVTQVIWERNDVINLTDIQIDHEITLSQINNDIDFQIIADDVQVIQDVVAESQEVFQQIGRGKYFPGHLFDNIQPQYTIGEQNTWAPWRVALVSGQNQHKHLAQGHMWSASF